MLRKLALFFVAGSLCALSGCGTIEGMGKDLRRGGENVEDASKDVHDDM